MAKPKEFYKLWIEYDFGQENLVFEEESDAIKWLKHEVKCHRVSFKELKDGGLFSVDTVFVWSPSK